MIAAMFTSPYGDRSGGSYSPWMSICCRRTMKYSTIVIPAHGLIHTTIETIHLSNDEAKLADSTNAMSTIVPTTPAAAATIGRLTFTPSERNASEQE
jgi:hypothetical protein